MQWGGLSGQNGPYREWQGVPEMGHEKASQAPIPSQKVSWRSHSAHTHDRCLERKDAFPQERQISPLVMAYLCPCFLSFY